MGRMKDLLITIHGGGDEAVEAARKLVDEGKWVPLSESKPDEYETVMVCHKGKVYCGELRHPDSETPWGKSWWMLFKYSHPSREWADGAFVDESDCWMPLPDPPEAKA